MLKAASLSQPEYGLELPHTSNNKKNNVAYLKEQYM